MTDPQEELTRVDAALRSVWRDGPPASLRARCLPGALPVKAEAPPRRILVVDDEPNIRRLIEHHLRRAGYEVLTAADGHEALERVREDRPDLVILDVMMPGPDGFQVLRTLKDDPRTADLQVILLTAKAQDTSIRYGWLNGTDFYMTKPFNPEELRTIVDRFVAALGTPETPAPLRRWLK